MQGNTVQGRIHWWESNRAVPRLLSGIEAGVIGGVAMLGLLVSGSLLRGDPWWMPSNLLGSTFYGARALSAGPDRSTLAGSALHVFMTGSIGGAFGLICGGIRRRRRLVLLGTLAGIIWQGLTFYLAVESPGTWILCEALVFATHFGGRTSKKIRRRVERNPV